jgi:hypothetical protein
MIEITYIDINKVLTVVVVVPLKNRTVPFFYCVELINYGTGGDVIRYSMILS